MSLSSENNNTNNLFCSRCGNEYSIKSRYCMKCGNLNPYHPENQSMSKYISNDQINQPINTYNNINNNQVNQPMNAYNNINNTQVNQSINTYNNINNTEGNTIVNDKVQIKQNEENIKSSNVIESSSLGNFNVCFYLNLSIYLFLIIVTGLSFIKSSDYNLVKIAASGLSKVWIIISLTSIFLYSTQLIYMKMNNAWWVSFIPIVNTVVFSSCLFNNPLIGLLMYVPGIGVFFGFALLYKLGEKFKRSGIITMFLGVLMYPIIGFGNSSFEDCNYVSKNNTLEKQNKKKHIFIIICGLFLLLSFLMNIYVSATHIKEPRYYFSTSAKVIEKELDNKIKNNEITCSGQNNDGNLYFYFENIEDYFTIPYFASYDSISAIVRVEQNDTNNKYYITLSDGRYGIDETLSSEIDDAKIESKYVLISPYDKNMCQVN